MNNFDIPKFIGEYEINQVIAKTTNNIICYATDSKDKYIIKLSQNPNLKFEFAILSKIHHPNILSAYHMYVIDDIISYTMPVAKGGDLHQYISYHFQKKRMLFEEKIRDILKQLLEALKYVHGLNIVHRDISPENIFFLDSQYENICLADFEFACDVRYIKDFAGKSAYMAPEMHKQKMYDFKVDCWGVGVIMYMLLFGYYPFLKVDQNGNVDPNLFWDVDSIINARYRYGRFKRSRAAIELLNGLLEPNPESRFSAEEALNHKWFTEPLPLIKLKKDKKAGIAKVSNLSVINREIQEAQQLIGQEDPSQYVL